MPEIQFVDQSRLTHYQQVLLAWIKQQHRETSQAQFLDIGSGTGVFPLALQDAGYQVTASEHSRETVDQLIKRELAALELDLQQPAPAALEGRFDVVTAVDVLEHLIDPVLALQTINSLLVPGGELYLSTPNFNSYRDLYLYLRGKDATIHHNPYHLRFFNFRTVFWLLKKQGFELRQWHRDLPLTRLTNQFTFCGLGRLWDTVCLRYGVHIIIRAVKIALPQLSRWIEARELFYRERGI